MMDVDYLNPVISSLEETFKTMLNIDVHRSGLELMSNNLALHPVSGIIGISGKGVGTIVLSLSNDVAIKAASTMLMMDIDEVSDDVLDAVGELTNMISGGAKARLAAFSLSMSLPNVLCGDNCRLHFPSNAHPIAIPFKCDWGLLGLQVGFSLRS